MHRTCFLKEKTPEFTKMGELHELFVLALSLVWFAGVTPEQESFRMAMRDFGTLSSDLTSCCVDYCCC